MGLDPMQWVILIFYGIFGFIFFVTAITLLLYLVGLLPDFKEQHSKKLINAFLVELAFAVIGIVMHGPPDIFSTEVELQSNFSPQEVYAVDHAWNPNQLSIFALVDSDTVDSIIYDPLNTSLLANNELVAKPRENNIEIHTREYDENGKQRILGYMPRTDTLIKTVSSAEILATYGLYLGIGLKSDVQNGEIKRRDSHQACQYLESAIEKGGKTLGNDLGDRVAKTLFHIYVSDQNDSCNPAIVKQAINYYRISNSQRSKEIGDVYARQQKYVQATAHYLSYLVTEVDDEEARSSVLEYLDGAVNRMAWPDKLSGVQSKIQSMLDSRKFEDIEIQSIIESIDDYT